MKIALLQFNPVVGSPAHNGAQIIAYMKKAKEQGAQLLIAGELSLNGYYSQDLFFNQELIEKTEAIWGKIKQAARKMDIGIGVGLVRGNPQANKGAKHLYNTFKLFIPQEQESCQDKVCLPAYGEFDENRWFEPASIKNVLPKKILGNTVGFVICEDGWNNKFGVPASGYRLYAHDPIEHLFEQEKISGEKISFVVNISASPDYIGKQQLRLKMNQRMAKHYKTPIIFLNVVGAQDELIFGGRSFVVNKVGQLVHEMKAFSEDLLVLDTDNLVPQKTKQKHSGMAELDGLMGLYLKDYFFKSKIEAPKTILGLSGGKDSTAVACILKRHLGAASVLGIMMPYRMGLYTQEQSKSIAMDLSKKLGIEVREIPIDKAVDDLTTDLNVEETSLAHQNLQARIRATILWTIANKENRVVINTTNFSEAAMGYGTIGGDLLGLPILASLPATMVIEYLKWLKSQGEMAITDKMIHRPPSAELAPGQLDANELGEYSYIDPIIESLRMHFGDLKKVVRQFSQKTPQYSVYNATKKRKLEFIEKVKYLSKKLLVQSEFKRWYYNKTPQFTPFSWLRWKWPIANGFMDTDALVAEACESEKFI